ncbi:MAG: xylulose 5-phosphate 3-epimerase [Clostridiales bacterium GWC2_40_7]|nr:MAG: xylulose 5-phosphate 3-epimerase [Clostridiales bacterium GWC2_40_7]
MKKGINIWSFPQGMKTGECIKLAKKAGFEGIELVLNKSGEMSLESTDSEILHYKELACEVGIEISSLATGLYWNYSLTSNNENIRENAKNIVRKQIDFASVLGTDTILVVPGVVGIDFTPNQVVPDADVEDIKNILDIVDYDVAYGRALEAIQQLAPYAEEKNVVIGIENVWNKFLLSPLEMRDFIDRIHSGYVGIYLDVGNIVYTGYPEQWIKILGSRIKKIHFKDYRRDARGLAGFVDLLAGDVDYVKVVDALERIGYEDYVNAEMTPVYKYYSDQIIYNTSNTMDRILKKTVQETPITL